MGNKIENRVDSQRENSVEHAAEKQGFGCEFFDWVMTFTIVAVLSIACNMVGYGGRLLESIPGMAIFALISLAGLTIKHFVPGNLPAVAYIALIGMVAAMPFSPVSGFVIYWAGKVSLMAVVTPILAYADRKSVV